MSSGLDFCASVAGGISSIPSRGTKICMPHSAPKKRKENLVKNGEFYS